MFYRAVPEKLWTTKLTIDKSQRLSGGLFLSLHIAVAASTLNYESLLSEARDKFARVIRIRSSSADSGRPELRISPMAAGPIAFDIPEEYA